MDNIILHCGHCNNIAPHRVVFQTQTSEVWDQIDDQEIIQTFIYHVVECGTCKHISVLGGFELELGTNLQNHPVLFPESNELDGSVPAPIRPVYSEAAKIRKRAPNAFAGQIRKALEYLCKDKNAAGQDLYHQLQSMASMGVLPSVLAEMSDIIRQIGNAGVHADKGELNIWDADLVDEFFKSVVNYVYIAPAKIERLRKLLVTRREETGENSGG